MDKRHILFMIDGLEYGGGERVFVQLATGLRNRFRVCAASVCGGTFEHEIKQLGIKFYSVDMSRRFSLKLIPQIKEIIRSNKIDLIHSQGGRADFYARIAARMLKPKVKIVNTVATLVKGYDVGALRKIIYRFFDWFSKRYVDRFIVVSEVLRETLLSSYRIQPDKVIKIYNGIELDEYRPNGKVGVGKRV
ncbi:MAG: glycosyltransferase [Deltaproteobacteria bacterium]|nr:glycosyltransferase [Deltaproteobacteria bacterium]